MISRFTGLPLKSVSSTPVEREDGHVAVGEEVNVARVVEDAGDVRGDEVLAFANTDDDRGAGARGDDLVGLGRGKDAECKCACEALDGPANGIFEQDGLAGGFGVVLNLFE